MDIRDCLKYHFDRYPAMMPKDAVKLVYQSAFGGGHLVRDEASALELLKEEIEHTQHSDTVPTIEYIGASACRVSLAALPRGLTAHTLMRIFVESSKMSYGGEAAFREGIAAILALIEAGAAPPAITCEEMVRWLDLYYSEGGGMTRHSLEYSTAYAPAYSVIHENIAPFLGVFAAIDTLLANKNDNYVPVVTIDGRCGSGKSTLADLLFSVYRCGVVHTDDFFLPTSLRTKERLSTPGKNIHYERFNSEISESAATMRPGDTIKYGVFDCQCGTITSSREVVTEPFLLIEGSYSSSPDITIKRDLCIFLTVSDEEQLRRIAERSQDKYKYADFINKWIPMEEEYFKSYNIKESSDIVINTEKPKSLFYIIK